MDDKTQIKDAEYYLLRGELLLLRREDQEGVELLEHASELDPLNPTIFYRQGLSLFEFASHEHSEKMLSLAIRKLKEATRLNPNLIEPFHVLGNALCHAGIRHKNEKLLSEAENCYQKALRLTATTTYDALPDLHWDYGNVWSAIYDSSKELSDLQKAILAYEKAGTFPELISAEFWIDFGKAQWQFAKQSYDIRPCIKAIHCFKQAVIKETPTFEGWSYLAKAVKTLYEFSHEEDHFSQAVEFFEAALQLKTQEAPLWVEYTRLLCDSGRRNRDTKRVRTCIEKCHRGYAYHSNNAELLSIWAEAMAILGELSDRVDLIYEAQNKISEALDMTEEDPEVWYCAGMCAKSLATYFNDYDYYYQVIEKFQIGLSIDRTCHRLWHAMATSYAALANFTIDAKEMDKAVKFFQKAATYSPSSFYLIDYATALSKFGEVVHNKDYLENALAAFEQALNQQKNAIYLHPDWLFHYASTLDLLGDFNDEESYYNRAIEIFCHVVMIDPDYPQVHHRLAQTFCHLGDLIGNSDHFYRAVHHLRMAFKHDEENDQIILDWAMALIHIGQHAHHAHDADLIYREAEHKLMQAVRLGNLQAYYHLGCLCSILRQYDKAMFFIQKADAFKSLPPMEEILQDEWLDGLRSTVDFKDFIAHLEKSS